MVLTFEKAEKEAEMARLCINDLAYFPHPFDVLKPSLQILSVRYLFFLTLFRAPPCLLLNGSLKVS